MREEVQRIIKMVQEGKLSAEDAADLIDAFNAPEQGEAPPPPPPPQGGTSSIQDSMKRLIESMERVGRENFDSVDWKTIADTVRTEAKKGADALKTHIESVSRGKFNFPFFGPQELKIVTLPLAVNGKALRIENPSGHIKVTGGANEGQVVAHAKIRGNTVEEAKAKAGEYNLIIEESEHQIVIKQPEVPGLDVELVFDIDRSSHIDVDTYSGDVTLLQTGGGCRIDNKSGDVMVKGLPGSVDVNLTSGNVTVQEVSGSSTTIHTTSGDVVLRAVQGVVIARTSSGEIRSVQTKASSLGLATVSGDLRIVFEDSMKVGVDGRTVSGDVEVALPSNSDFKLSLSSVSGQVSCALPLSDSAKAEGENSPQSLTGKVGDGTGNLSLNTVSGDVHVIVRDPVVTE
jgi:hypothetical protein